MSWPQPFGYSARIAEAASDAQEAILLLDKTIQFDALNYEGLRKILKKFDKRTGFGVSTAVLADLRHCGFVADSAAGGAGGRCAALRNALCEVLSDLQIPN
jgi:hypothetical protein